VKSEKRVGIQRWRRAAIFGLFLIVPTQMGGCPEFQNASVTAVETAFRGILDAALDLAFDQFRTGRTS
jgi:hypothetical protein